MASSKFMDAFQDRSYHRALIDVCMHRNSIVCLPTNAERIFIAAQVVKRLESKSTQFGKRSVFLFSDSRSVKKNIDRIRNLLPYEIRVLDDEQVLYFEDIPGENVIIITTGEKFAEVMKNSSYKLEQINAIVFDSCHWAAGDDHPYREILIQLQKIQAIRVIGLSDILVAVEDDINPSNVAFKLKVLEKIFQSEIVTSDNVSLSSTITPKLFVSFKKESFAPSVAKVSKILRNMKEKLESSCITSKDVIEWLGKFDDFDQEVDVFGPIGGYLNLLNALAYLEMIRIKKHDAKNYPKEVLSACITLIESCLNRMERSLNLDDPSSILQNSSHKVRKLISMLREKLNDRSLDDFSCIIFVEKCSSAKILHNALTAFAKSDPSFTIAVELLLQVKNDPESTEGILSKHHNDVALHKFQNKKINCIITSKSGISSNMCNLAVMFDEPLSYRSYMLTKQSASNENSTVAFLIENDRMEDFKEKVLTWQLIDAELSKQLLMRIMDEKLVVDQRKPIDEKQPITVHHPKLFTREYHAAAKKTSDQHHYYEIKTPDVLQHSAPIIDGKSFLYHIKINPKFDITIEAIKMFQNFASSANGFAILTSKEIPKLCKFSLFTSFGEVEIEFSGVPTYVTLKNQTEVAQLKNFHVGIFRDVNKTWMNCFVIDNDSYLIVPVKHDGIDWALVNEFQVIEQPRKLSPDEIDAMEITHDNYFHRIVTPIYREAQPKYVVVNVLDSMSPLSPFPSKQFSSFKEHVEKNYEQTIHRLDQPMLEVRRMNIDFGNLFFPEDNTNAKLRKHDQSVEYYIPECLHNFKLPADYWFKAFLLPWIFHRFDSLLLAEELRMKLIIDGIDGGSGSQENQLDVDHKNACERRKAIDEYERAHETAGKLSNISQHQNVIREGFKTKASFMWHESHLPLNIDQNLLTVTEADIAYSCFFFKNQNKILPASISRLQQLNGTTQCENLTAIKTDTKKEISLLSLTGKQSVQQKDILKVLTPFSAADVIDNQRYKMLGNAFLKFVTSMHLFKTLGDDSERSLTSLRDEIMSASNLFCIGSEFGLAGRIKLSKVEEALPPSLALPKNLHDILVNDKILLINILNADPLSEAEIVSGLMDELTLESFRKPQTEIESLQNDDDRVEKSMLSYIRQQYISDEAVSDAVEALNGVVVQSVGIQAGLKLYQKLKVLPEDQNLDIFTIDITKINKNTREMPINNRPKLEEIISYKFEDPTYLVQAFTYSTSSSDASESYDRLKFLGAAVIDFLLTSFIVEHCPAMELEKLKDLRSALTNNVMLACIVVRNGIHKFLIFENFQLSEAINKFVDYQECRDHRVFDDIILLSTEDDKATTDSVDVPRIIGDLFESILGAVFLDSALNFVTTWNVIYKLLEHELRQFMCIVPDLNIVRRLYEFEERSAEAKIYESEETGDGIVAVPMEIKINVEGDRKVFVGSGRNSQIARNCAAKLAMKYLLQKFY